MPTGLYRDADDWVMVNYGTTHAQIHRERYELNGYRPPFFQLPAKNTSGPSQSTVHEQPYAARKLQLAAG